jgi:hypothetical protein
MQIGALRWLSSPLAHRSPVGRTPAQQLQAAGRRLLPALGVAVPLLLLGAASAHAGVRQVSSDLLQVSGWWRQLLLVLLVLVLAPRLLAACAGAAAPRRPTPPPPPCPAPCHLLHPGRPQLVGPGSWHLRHLGGG